MKFDYGLKMEIPCKKKKDNRWTLYDSKYNDYEKYM